MTLGPIVISRADELPCKDFLPGLRSMQYPKSVLMCPPDYFDVVDEKNPYMKGQAGKVNRAIARKQWDAIKSCFEEIGITVESIPAVKDCEDMVFAANQIFVGLSVDGRRLCSLSHMKFPSRQKEVPHFCTWFQRRGYGLRDMAAGGHFFEGGGDAIWHPGRGLIWGGHGIRSEPEVYPEIAALFGVPVFTLELTDARFYHLDTCFCPINETTALAYMPALTEAGQGLVRSAFQNLVEVDEYEATEFMACNAAALGGTNVVIQRGAEKTLRSLRELGFRVHEVETGEFMKSGGSVFCMKTGLF